jgi:hypothetical protein
VCWWKGLLHPVFHPASQSLPVVIQQRCLCIGLPSSFMCSRSWKREQALCLLKRPRSECEEHLQEAAEDWQEDCQRLQEDCCQRLHEDCCQRLQEDEKLQQDEDKGQRQQEEAAQKDRLMVQSAGGRRDQLISDSNSVHSRVGIFQQKNYSAEDAIDGTTGLFLRNFGCSTEQNTLGIPFRTILQRRKMLGILYRGTN